MQYKQQQQPQNKTKKNQKNKIKKKIKSTHFWTQSQQFLTPHNFAELVVF